MKAYPYLYFLALVVVLFSVVNAGRWLKLNAETRVLSSEQYYRKCLVADGCRINENGVSVIFRVLPASLPVLQPLQLEVILEGISAESVSVEFVGRDMPMGLMPVRLKKQWYSILTEHYKGEGSISFCTSDSQMVWIARLSIKTQSHLSVVEFELQQTPNTH
ncbi:MAG: hypothetical protein QS721_11810 [Candidatus Endonucleobacter sp. (ex Gigantidas childressi)]|nr:hypothetical protein [Candidatus Endonucleobacter sp. (ex Gigantidas childressi)]